MGKGARSFTRPVHKRVWAVSWGLLIIALLGWLSAQN